MTTINNKYFSFTHRRINVSQHDDGFLNRSRFYGDKELISEIFCHFAHLRDGVEIPFFDRGHVLVLAAHPVHREGNKGDEVGPR